MSNVDLDQLLLLQRAVRVTVFRPIAFNDKAPKPNAVVIEDLRVEFKIEKTIKSEPNKLELTLTNLATNTRGEMQAKPLSVIVEAGYGKELHQLFFGDVRHAYSQTDGPDWHTKINAGDGDRAYRYGALDRSYDAGVPVIKVIREAAQAMGMSVPDEVSSTIGKDSLVAGYTLAGPTREQLTILLAAYGYEWSMQSGKLQVLREGQPRETAAELVSQDTGLIGSPEWSIPENAGEPPTMKFKMLLNPRINPGGKVQVKSRSTNGTFRAEKVTHQGDTHGDDWTTEVECKPV